MRPRLRTRRNGLCGTQRAVSPCSTLAAIRLGHRASTSRRHPMDDRRFDNLTRALAAMLPRRALTGAALVAAARFAMGAGEEAASKKRKKKKKKKPASCPNRSCLNKVCGQDDGCGTPCTVQAGCDTDEACINGACAGNVCTPPCTGNKICQPNGSCACPSGLKECSAAGGFPGYCHECCYDGFEGPPDAECIGSAGGPYCREDDGDLINWCSCYPGQKSCGGGVCGLCCDVSDCFIDVFNDGQNVDSGRDCLVANETTGELTCQCRTGFRRCTQTSSVCAAPDTLRLCGPECAMDCARFPGSVCRDERCCMLEAGKCQSSQDCCGDLGCRQQTVAPFDFVCTDL
jgi:hypothetical protein